MDTSRLTDCTPQSLLHPKPHLHLTAHMAHLSPSLQLITYPIPILFCGTQNIPPTSFLWDCPVSLFNTLFGFLMPLVSAYFVLNWLATALRHVSGVTASVFTAFPVCSGFSGLLLRFCYLTLFGRQSPVVQAGHQLSGGGVEILPFSGILRLHCYRYLLSFQIWRKGSVTGYVSSPFITRKTYSHALAHLQAV